MLSKIQITPQKLPFEKPAGQQKAAEKGDETFNATLKGFIDEVNQLQQKAGESIDKLAAGEINDVHDVMVAVEKASTSFELMMQIRNKILEAYREVMRTQV